MKKLTKKEKSSLYASITSLKEQLTTLNFWFKHLTDDQRAEKRIELEALLAEIQDRLDS